MGICVFCVFSRDGGTDTPPYVLQTRVYIFFLCGCGCVVDLFGVLLFCGGDYSTNILYHQKVGYLCLAMLYVGVRSCTEACLFVLLSQLLLVPFIYIYNIYSIYVCLYFIFIFVGMLTLLVSRSLSLAGHTMRYHFTHQTREQIER